MNSEVATGISIAEPQEELSNEPEPVELRPMVIDFKALQVSSPSSSSAEKTESDRENHVAADEDKAKERSKLIKVTSPK